MKLAFSENEIQLTSAVMGNFAAVGLREYDAEMDNVQFVGSDLAEYHPSPGMRPIAGAPVWVINLRGRTIMAHTLERAMSFLRQQNKSLSTDAVENDGDI